jgi:hypothetical protein
MASRIMMLPQHAVVRLVAQMRELAAVTEAGTALDQAWARQAIDVLLALKDAADAACQRSCN